MNTNSDTTPATVEVSKNPLVNRANLVKVAAMAALALVAAGAALAAQSKSTLSEDLNKKVSGGEDGNHAGGAGGDEANPRASDAAREDYTSWDRTPVGPATARAMGMAPPLDEDLTPAPVQGQRVVKRPVNEGQYLKEQGRMFDNYMKIQNKSWSGH